MKLPEDAGIEDAEERLYFVYKVERGLRQISEDKTVSNDEAKARLAKWLS